MIQLTIQAQEAGQKLTRYLCKYLDKAPKSFIYKAIRTNKVKLNGKKVKGEEVLNSGDEIKLFLTDDVLSEMVTKKQVTKTKISFDVVYEDENILIVNKPEGVLTQKDTKESISLADEVIYYLADKGEYNINDKGFVPAPCNRLDRNTSGLVLVGKNIAALQQLSEMIKTKAISKYYVTIVHGEIKKPMILKGYHTKDNNKNEVKIVDEYSKGAKPVETHLKPISTNGKYSLVEIELITGKTHQIRAHLSKIGHPIIGDAKYGKDNEYFKKKYKLKNQVLCAYKLEFEQCEGPLDYMQGKVIEIEIPKMMKNICIDEKLIV